VIFLLGYRLTTCAQESHELVILGFIKRASEHPSLVKKKLEEVPIKAARV
jgi:hypothetical protein